MEDNVLFHSCFGKERCSCADTADCVMSFHHRSASKIDNGHSNKRAPADKRSRTWSGPGFLNRKRVGELDLSLCSFNYTRLDGVQSSDRSAGGSQNTRGRGRGEQEGHGRLSGQWMVNSADRFTRHSGDRPSILHVLTDSSDRPVSMSSEITSCVSIFHCTVAIYLRHSCLPVEG